MSFESRPLADLVNDHDGAYGRVTRMGGLLTGLSVLFGGLAALTAIGGIWAHEPLFVMSAGFALTAAAAFALCAQALARAASPPPRVRMALATVPVKSRRRAA